MRKILLFLLPLLLSGNTLHSQSIANAGKPIAEIFTDLHYNLNDTVRNNGFGLNRAYFGYSFLPPGNFSSSIIITIGNPEDLPLGSKHRRYAYFREASITWTKENLNINFGITGTRIFEFQQKFWGKRYIANTYQSINGYGFIADLGVVADYKINDILKADLTIMNGEGYSEVQLDNNLRTSIGLTITPEKHLAIRIYGDVTRPKGLTQFVFVGFAGYKNDLVTIGAEASYKSNLDLIEGHHAWGISGTGAIGIFKKAELFLRYDYSSSVVAPGDIIQWNYQNDRNFVIYGIQYTFSQNVKMALNYQGIYPFNPLKQATDALFLNALFKF